MKTRKTGVRSTIKSEKGRRQKGITLVALVITIIVLLILAGVGINMAISSEGLFVKAHEAVDKWNQSVAEEGNIYENLLLKANEINVEGQKVDAGKANIPIIPDGDMKVEYVTYTKQEDETWKEVLSEVEPENWYNYGKKQWANIKTTSKTQNEDGKNNEAYWVWIPRFAYQVPEKPTLESGNGDVTFNIAFLEGTTDIPVDESVLGGKKIGTNATVGEWVVHPVFNFGGTPLEGIWVAKYEASSSNPSAENGGGNDVNLQVNIKPDVASWRNINVSNIFSVCQNMKDEKGALEGSSKADPHMMKNVEWGAVVYLSQSQYGKGEQVWNNPSSSSKTGQAGFSADDAKVSSTESYLTPNGVQASTTGNPYGIYDMAGESWEYVAAYVDNSSAKSSTNITALREADAKYKDVYTAQVVIRNKQITMPIVVNTEMRYTRQVNKEQAIVHGKKTDPTSRLRAILFFSAGAIGMIARMPVCSVSPVAVTVGTAAIRSARCVSD